MSGPQSSDPTRPSSAPSDPTRQADAQPTETPWWQQVKRRQEPTPDYSAQPQNPPYQQAAYPSAPAPPYQQPAQQPAQQGPYYPQYGQQPGQYSYPQGAAPAGTAAQPKQSKRWLLITGGLLIGAVAAAAVVLGLLRFGAFGHKVIDVNKAQEAVKHVITDPTGGYGIGNVTDVKCNNGENPTAKKGDSFTCDVTVNGKKHQAMVVFVDDNGTYEVDRPR